MTTKTNYTFTGISLDFETGGLDCLKSAVTQIAMKAFRFDTLEVMDSYVKYIYPYQRSEPLKKTLKPRNAPAEMMSYEDKALSISGITLDRLYESGYDIALVAKEIIGFVQSVTLTTSAQHKPVLIGQNIGFDIGFLQQMMSYTNMLAEFEKCLAGRKDFYGNFQPLYLDTLILTRLALANDKTVGSFKLDLIAEKLGIPLDDAHDAQADVTAALNILFVLTNRMRNVTASGKLITENKTRPHFKI